MARRQSLETLEKRRQARDLYWQGWQLFHIAEHLKIRPQTIHNWKLRDRWDESSPLDRCKSITESRYIQLVSKTEKDPRDFKEIDLLGREMERLARVTSFIDSGGKPSVLNPKMARKGIAGRKNEISPEQRDRLYEAFRDWMKPHQRQWYEAGQRYKIRNILGSRQIGKSQFFAYEALDDALQTGRNQVWLSASKAQAFVGRQYIQQLAKEAADVDLRGDPIIIPRDCCAKNRGEDPGLYFLGTNSLTAQSYHGNFLFDEYFWVYRFRQLQGVASAMASQKMWRETYFSTPSAVTHEAYRFWSGDQFNEGRNRRDRIKLDISHQALKDGRRCEDGQWRQIVTIEDAIAQGFDLFDLDHLKLTKSPDEFANKFLCQFIDDSASAFSFASLMACMVDSWAVWHDFKPHSPRPLGCKEVWLGYDPNLESERGDTAGLVAIAPPAVESGKYRAVEKQTFYGLDFEAQNEAIKAMAARYEVTYIGIDASGLGAAVYELVRQWYPGVKAISYSLELKNRMILQMYNAISKGRFEFDAGWHDYLESFLAIRKVMTGSGKSTTYASSRSNEISHSELAWATMHCMINSPIEGRTDTNQSIVEMF